VGRLSGRAWLRDRFVRGADGLTWVYAYFLTCNATHGPGNGPCAVGCWGPGTRDGQGRAISYAKLQGKLLHTACGDVEGGNG
jgi:hypothetical protein